jgi:hypothetical protein
MKFNLKETREELFSFHQKFQYNLNIYVRFQLGPAVELSTLGCSNTQKNTLHVLQRAIGPCTS